MAEIESIITAIKNVAEEAEIAVISDYYPYGSMKRYSEPVVAVGLKSGSDIDSGFVNYMGEKYDELTGKTKEVYGKKLKLTLLIKIYSPEGESRGAKECVRIFEELIQASTNAYDGINVDGVSCGEVKFDYESEMYLLDAEMKITAHLYSEMTDDGEFYDFNLKGELKL